MLEAKIEPTLEGFIALYFPENAPFSQNDKNPENVDFSQNDKFKTEPRETKNLLLRFKNAIEKKNKTATKAQKINFDNPKSPVEKGFLAIIDKDKLDIEDRAISDQMRVIWKLSEPDETSEIMGKGRKINIFNRHFMGGKNKQTKKNCRRKHRKISRKL